MFIFKCTSFDFEVRGSSCNVECSRVLVCSCTRYTICLCNGAWEHVCRQQECFPPTHFKPGWCLFFTTPCLHNNSESARFTISTPCFGLHLKLSSTNRSKTNVTDSQPKPRFFLCFPANHLWNHNASIETSPIPRLKPRFFVVLLFTAVLLYSCNNIRSRGASKQVRMCHHPNSFCYPNKTLKSPGRSKARSKCHAKPLQNMGFDEIFDLTAARVYFYERTRVL